MTYAISDLHGRYDLYVRMLERIGFTEKDTLYILGDFVDRGDEGLRIVLDVAERQNVIPLMGNHDLYALSILSNLDKGVDREKLEDMSYLINMWKLNGGMPTYTEYKKLSPEERKLALMTIDSFKSFAEIKVGEREFILCHGGIKDHSESRPLTNHEASDFIFFREDYSKPKFTKQAKYLITGHTPTAAIEGATEGKIYKNHDHIAIDCGAVFGLGLGCLCLDTMEEFYVK